MVVDDLLPTGANGRLLCSASTDNELWVSIVEKAYLKVHPYSIICSVVYGGDEAWSGLAMVGKLPIFERSHSALLSVRVGGCAMHGSSGFALGGVAPSAALR